MTHENAGEHCKVNSRKMRFGVAAAALFISGALTGGLLTVAAGAYAHERGHGIERIDGEGRSYMQRGIQRKLNRALAEVDATPEQRDQADDILADFLNDFEPLKDALRGQRKALVQALFAEEVDRARIETIRGDTVDTAEQMSRELTEGMTALAQVLEPEQRAQVAEFLARHHRHRRH